MKQSEWHEQVDFSDLYFKAVATCREQESNNNLLGWKYALEAKITLIMGILNEEEKEEIYYLKSQIHSIWIKYYNEDYKLGNNSLSSMHPVTSSFRSTLFLVESKIDTMVNSKMPFLNIKKKVDIRGL
tara:strand:- start:2244 stop:2627 length:384 start_codon:yes stop_codon:yes gene_type:complete